MLCMAGTSPAAVVHQTTVKPPMNLVKCIASGSIDDLSRMKSVRATREDERITKENIT
jgi:hypothetical protein